MEQRLRVVMERGRHLNPDPKAHIAYGTAGFRTRAEKLDHVMFRMGILAAIRSAKTGAVIGVMITASHNPACDNGVKLVDPEGEMLEASWEQLATRLANAADDQLWAEIQSICATIDIKSDQLLTSSRVAIGVDTRPSSVPLAGAVREGVDVAGAALMDFGLSTTPQLHYYVRCLNTKGAYGAPNEGGYFKKMFNALVKLKDLRSIYGDVSRYKPHLVVDGANGVGAIKAKLFLPLLEQTGLKIKIVNDGDGEDDVLNQDCGADFVKTTQSASKNADATPGRRHCAVDGDADRIVYFYFDAQGVFRLLDGDKISSFIAKFIKDLLSKAGLEAVDLGVVQTAYANGSSTLYMTSKLGIPVACVPTGVKHLHHRALQFDIGVYFEANGHGTVVFSESTATAILKRSQNPTISETQRHSAKQLVQVMDLINQTVGDALSDMLLVETALMYFDWDCEEWNDSYTDFPNRLMKCQVPDRTAVQTTDAERKVTSPSGLQEKIDKILLGFPPTSRAFVRPSGTEDVVRVYAETPESQEETDDLAKAVVKAVKDQFAHQDTNMS